MDHKLTADAPAVYDYIAANSLRPPACLGDLLAATREVGPFGMATPQMQCQFLAFLIRAMGATRALEVGVFTGVGTLWMAEAIGPQGKIVACDVSEEYTSVGRRFWEQAGVAERIDLRLAPAADTLASLAEEESGSFDFCYIDADKDAYDTYYELVLPLLRPGGVVAFDNMLRGGAVIDAGATDKSTEAIRELNAKLHKDQRVDVSFLPVCDGLYLACKR